MDNEVETRAKAHIREGVQLFNTNDYPRAQTAFETAADLVPDAPEVLHNLGNVLQNQGNWNRALNVHQHALTLFTRCNDAQGIVWTLSNLGNVYYGLGKLKEALT